MKEALKGAPLSGRVPYPRKPLATCSPPETPFASGSHPVVVSMHFLAHPVCHKMLKPLYFTGTWSTH